MNKSEYSGPAPYDEGVVDTKTKTSLIRGVTTNRLRLAEFLNAHRDTVQVIGSTGHQFDLRVATALRDTIAEALRGCCKTVATLDEKEPSGESNGLLERQFVGNPAAQMFKRLRRH